MRVLCRQCSGDRSGRLCLDQCILTKKPSGCEFYSVTLAQGVTRYLKVADFVDIEVEEWITFFDRLSPQPQIEGPWCGDLDGIDFVDLAKLFGEMRWGDGFRVHHSFAVFHRDFGVPSAVYYCFHSRLSLRSFEFAECVDSWVKEAWNDSSVAESFGGSVQHLILEYTKEPTKPSQFRWAIFKKTPFVLKRLETLSRENSGTLFQAVTIQEAEKISSVPALKVHVPLPSALPRANDQDLTPPAGHWFPAEPKPSDSKYLAWNDPAGREYGFTLDHLRWEESVKQIKAQIEAEKFLQQREETELSPSSLSRAARNGSNEEALKRFNSPLTEQRLEIFLRNCPSSDGCQWLEISQAANFTNIFSEQKLTTGLCRQIADKIESVGYCVEPDARFGGGIYEWKQVLGLFRPFGGDSPKPSTAYVGAANLLRLCVLISAADGKIDEIELDVFRSVIENQLDLTRTDHHRLVLLERMLTKDPSSAAKTVAGVAKSLPVHKRALIAKVLVRVAAADGVITKDERRGLERIFRAFDLSSETMDRLIQQVVPDSGEFIVRATTPSPESNKQNQLPPRKGSGTKEISRTDQAAVELAAFNKWMSSYLDSIPTPGPERIPESAPATPPQSTLIDPVLPRAFNHQVAATPPQTFALDMSKVLEITNATREVVEILSVLMEDEPEKPATPSRTVIVPAPETARISSDGKAVPEQIRFNGLDVAFHPILERLLTRDSWPKADINALAREFHFMPLNIHDTLNEWADEVLGDFLLDGENPIVIRRELILKVKI